MQLIREWKRLHLKAQELMPYLKEHNTIPKFQLARVTLHGHSRHHNLKVGSEGLVYHEPDIMYFWQPDSHVGTNFAIWDDDIEIIER